MRSVVLFLKLQVIETMVVVAFFSVRIADVVVVTVDVLIQKPNRKKQRRPLCGPKHHQVFANEIDSIAIGPLLLHSGLL